ncbi:MAG: efflux RND transporter periplasmic adaptor subunit [Anaerolineales bacterium]|nr:efflux RND transporter periplasmic adaptor subunit [Anaerolineales bacterium]
MKTLKLRKRWIALFAVAALLVAGGYLVATRTTLLAQNSAPSTTSAADTGDAATQPPTVEIQSAAEAQTPVSAAGNLELVDERSVALEVAGIVRDIKVALGDTVNAGDVLLKLDTTDLERALAQAKLSVESAKIAIDDLQTPATASEIAKAQASLEEAQENLADVAAGPGDQEIAAARSSLAAAQASYSELQAGPSNDELTQLSADMKSAEITVAEAQRAYDQIAWQESSGMSSQAADLQTATIALEKARAAYAASTASATNSDLQSALSAIQSAQVQVNELVNSPTAAEIATAEAAVVDAEATLSDLQTGPTANEIRSAKITLEQALIELETAQRNLEAATVTAPIAGVITSLNAEVGVRSGADAVVAMIADTKQLQLVISVAEADIPRVSQNQAAQVEVDALPGQTFEGVVKTISPVDDSSSSAVSYPVTVRLTSQQLDGVLPGMNAVATLTDMATLSADSWLVPTNALRTGNGVTTVMVMRDSTPTPVTVTTGAVQGEWTTVASAELQAGDQVIGSLTSNLNSQNFFGPGGGAPPPGAMMGSGPMR